MAQDFPQSCMRFFLGDVRDGDRLIQAMNGVDYVIHAAALKQVPAAEYNPMECIKTNINGAQNVIQAALANNVDKVIALSTDKAANPINLYGATKLVSDKLFVAANNLAGGHQNPVCGGAVRQCRRLARIGGAFLPEADRQRLRLPADYGCEHDPLLDHSAAGRRFRSQELRPHARRRDLRAENSVDQGRRLGDGDGAPHVPQRIIGIRPGEKLHEVMCPADDSHLTLQFDDHYVIKPTIQFSGQVDFSVNKLGEKGRPVDAGFEYHSGKESALSPSGGDRGDERAG